MVKASQHGFTLIELVVVIVILGILAAFAVPRFMGLETEARVATVNSLAGSIRSAAAMAHGVCMARQCPSPSTIPIEGVNIGFVNGYPNRANIDDVLQSVDGFTYAAGTGRFTRTGALTPANCWVQYDQALATGAAPVVTFSGSAAFLRANC